MYKILIGVLMAVGLTACASQHSFVDEDTGLTTHPVWPQLNGHYAFARDGSEVHKLIKNMHKSDIRYILGTPHFSSTWRGVEWDYLLHFPQAGVPLNQETLCLLKITFKSYPDKEMEAKGFYWHAVRPANAQCPPAGF